MSGFLCILNLTGAPIDPGLLEAMTGTLCFRGQDALGTWSDGPVGFGHTLLRTTDEALHERQPLTLDGRVWIVADARIDDRERLIRELSAEGRAASLARPDVELILHAYHAWGDACVEHLLGDFAFGIWDGDRHRLFCARDQLGVRPFYYAVTRQSLVFSNTLNCVRRHPDVSAKLDDAAIVDFLVFKYRQDRDRTAFEDIKRLPPGNVLICEGGRTEIRSYWTGPRRRSIRYARPSDYVEQFRELHRQAVADRLRTDRVVVWMTGGLDSSSIAAVAIDLQRQRGLPKGVRARTIVYDKLIPDRERYYAGLVAQHLGIPIDFHVADDYKLFDMTGAAELRRPEPLSEYFGALSVDISRASAANGRVALTGNDADTLLAEQTDKHLLALLRRKQLKDFALGVVSHMRTWHRVPPLRVRTTMKRWVRGWKESEQPPEWLAPGMRARFRIDERWDDRLGARRKKSAGEAAVRPRFETALRAPWWTHLFEYYDAGVSGVPLEVRFPFMDLRLMEFLVSVPPIPWCQHKHILRRAMQSQLPSEVLRRPKAPLAGNPEVERLDQDAARRLDTFKPAPELRRFVVPERIPRARTCHFDIYRDTRAFSLNSWLCYAQPLGGIHESASGSLAAAQGLQGPETSPLWGHPADHPGRDQRNDEDNGRSSERACQQDLRVTRPRAWKYRAHGLALSADSEIPPLAPDSTASVADVCIHVGRSALPDSAWQTATTWYESPYLDPDGRPGFTALRHSPGSEAYRITYRDGVEFTISSAADEIWVRWPDGMRFPDTWSYLLGPILGIVLRLRGICALHASAILAGGVAATFVGAHGAGKSTLAAAFARRGVAVLADDTVALVERKGDWVTHPGYPRIRLWPDSAEHLSSQSNRPRLIPPGENGSAGRHHLDLTAHGYRFASNPVPIGAVYLLNESEVDAPSFKRLSPASAMVILLDNMFGRRAIDRRLRREEFDTLGRFVSDVPVWVLSRPSELSRLDALCDAVLDHLSAHGAHRHSIASIS